MFCAPVNAQESNLPYCPHDTKIRWHYCIANLKFSDGQKFVGEYRNNQRNGHGILSVPKKYNYEGEFRDDVFHGLGKIIFSNGHNYTGRFKNGIIHGEGTYTWSDGQKYIGEWKDNKRNGKGIQYNSNGSISQMGIWANDKFVGASNVGVIVPPVNASPPTSAAPLNSSGTAFRVSNGQFVTNHHVIEGCTTLKVGGFQGGRVLASDTINDLALIAIPNDSGEIVSVRTTRTQLNEAVTAAGFPLRSLGLSGLTITNGTISSLSGLKGDTGQVQISAPVQPGNSGGPLLDSAGNVIGVVSGKLNAMKVAGIIGDVPQNVNFAISSNALRAFLDAKGVNYKEAGNERELTGVQIAARASGFTVLVECR